MFHKRKTMIFSFGVKRVCSHFLPRDNQLKFLVLIEPFLDLYLICVVAIVSQDLGIDGLYRYLGGSTTIRSLIDLYYLLLQNAVLGLDLIVLDSLHQHALFILDFVPGREFEIVGGWVMADVCESLTMFAIWVMDEEVFGFGGAIIHFIIYTKTIAMRRYIKSKYSISSYLSTI